MGAHQYFNRPTHMAFHDLTTTKKPPLNLRSLLGLNLKFIPTPRYNTPWSYYENHTLPKFNRAMRLKAFFAYRHTGTDLIDDVSHPATIPPAPNTRDNYNARMHVPSHWEPPEKAKFPIQIQRRLDKFAAALKSTVRLQRSRSNLLPHQRRALAHLRSQEDFLIIQCDKNLGPAIIEREEYIKLVVRDHLSDSTTYRRLSKSEALSIERTILNNFKLWFRKYQGDLTDTEQTFLKHHHDTFTSTFSTFYATAKVHKATLSTRPIVSTSGTLLYALGVWCDDKLQKAAHRQQSYFKNTFTLKAELDRIILPPNAVLFTADAVSMYTNIPTKKAIKSISKYLSDKLFPGIPIRALMSALRQVMQYNVFTFGDTFWQQKTGTAMGTPPAPPWATLYYAIFEDNFLPDFKDDLLLYRRFIDDVFGIFLIDPLRPNRFETFAAAMNNPDHELTWIVEQPSQSVIFMDLRISVTGSRLKTSLYEKRHNLHLYIPPHSCHPPGLLPGMVHGQIFRIFTLCSERQDQHAAVRSFFRQLQVRGYSPKTLRPLFKKAINRAVNYSGPTSAHHKARQMARSILFHIRYHPKNPSSRELQRLWNRHICRPPFPARPLWKHRNYRFKKIEVDRMIVAYNRPPNLGNLLSYRRLKDTSGPPVSSFLD